MASLPQLGSMRAAYAVVAGGCDWPLPSAWRHCVTSLTSVPLRSLRCVRCVGWKPRLSGGLSIVCRSQFDRSFPWYDGTAHESHPPPANASTLWPQAKCMQSAIFLLAAQKNTTARLSVAMRNMFSETTDLIHRRCHEIYLVICLRTIATQKLGYPKIVIRHILSVTDLAII